MELWELATYLLNLRVGRPDRGHDYLPSVTELIAIPTTKDERETYTHMTAAFLKDEDLSVDKESLKAEIFSIANRVLEE